MNVPLTCAGFLATLGLVELALAQLWHSHFLLFAAGFCAGEAFVLLVREFERS